ncbi:hypothetical protein LTR41_008819 [Exophiala xenobiotica]|nr:hypothetical protein LTR41_008819 [Exophiala xenobiotica]KAK5413467.1 hypothetical protein LTR06_004894 [Exophiala xenobiotica]
MPPTSPSEHGRGRVTRLPGLGMVPSGPRFHRRHDIYRPTPHTRDVPSRLRSTPGHTEEESSSTCLSSTSSSTGPGSVIEQRSNDPSESNVPDYQFPTQYLMAGFARRQTVLEEQGARQKVDGRHRRRETVPQIAQTENTRSALQQNESAGENERKTQKFFIKRELSEAPTEDEDVLKSIHEYSSPTKLEQNMPDDEEAPGAPKTPVFKQQSPPEPPRPPSQLPPSAGRLAPDCACPTSLECPAREDALIDCRTLILDYKKWEIRERENHVPELPPDEEPENEHFVTLEEVTSVIRPLDNIGLRPRMSMSLRTSFIRIQNWVAKMQTNSVTQEILHKSRVLDRIDAFLGVDNAAMRQAKAVPVHIIEDLTWLQGKWRSGDLSVLARRGLRRAREDGPLFPDPDWPHKRPSDFFGHGHLVNGQTWIYRAEMMRDGAHGPPVAGISGTIKLRARSIVMGKHDEKNQHFYADVDEGDTIYYMGTALHRAEGDDEATNVRDPTAHPRNRIIENASGQGPTNATMCLITSYRNRKEVRVFRSHGASHKCPLRPERGYRYDGLYRVEWFQLEKQERQIYKFKLVRLTTGQGPLRLNLSPPLPEKKEKRKRNDDCDDRERYEER